MENGLPSTIVASEGGDQTSSKKSERSILGEISIDQGDAHNDTEYEHVYDECDSVDSRMDTDADRNTVENHVEINENIMKSPVNTTSDDNMNEINTPVMFDWKLSDATRNLVKNTSFLVPANRRNTLLGLADLELSAEKSSPKICENEARSRYQTPQQLLKSCHLLESSVSKADIGIETPVTPTIGTPFQTTSLQLTASKCSNSEAAYAPSAILDTSDQSPAHAVAESPVIVTNPVSSSPAKCAGMIAAVDHEEWIGTPSFLKLQLTTDVLNQAINEINTFIDQENIEIFTQEQIDNILCDQTKGLGLSKGQVKAVMLGLVTLKKMDLGTEGKNKVYKIKNN